jgi:hypothetical protein
MPEESNFATWARAELERAGLFDGDSDYGGMLGTEVLALVERFSAAGHSGFSAALTASVFARLAAWKPLTPITNAADEWMHVAADMAGEPNLWQSRRQPSLFSYDGGSTYYDLDETPPLWAKLLHRLRLRRRAVVYHVAALADTRRAGGAS